MTMRMIPTLAIIAGLQIGAHAQSPCDSLQACFLWSGLNSTVEFQNCSQGGAAPHYLWDFGDGTTSDSPSPEHHFPAPGSYTVCLTMVEPNVPDTCKSTLCQVITVDGGNPCDNLNAGFQVTTDGPVATFHSSNSTAQQYEWHFGDGTSGYGPMPVHTYAEPGTYTACLLVWAWNPLTQDTCYADHCETVVITGGNPCDNLNAGFQVTTDGPVATFLSSSSTAQHYEWHFGDGTIGYGPVQTHTYAEPGTYTACLVVRALNPQTQDSCFADHCETVVITGGNPCDSLIACFEPIELTGGGYYFENCTGMLPGAQFSWDFGDGHGSNGLHAEHHYDQPGTYTVCLIAYWQNCADTICTPVVVSGDSLCDGFEVTMSWDQGGNNTVLFTGIANLPPDGYVWDFGDGTQGYDQTETHTYAPGVYTVCLSAYRWNAQVQDSCWAHTCQTITITGGNPCDNLNAGFQVTTDGPVATFLSSSSTAQHYEWHFGDGTNGYGPVQTHTYAEPGTYTACLVVWAWNPQTQDSCFADHCETVVITGGNPCDSLIACFEPIELTGGGYYFENCTGMLPGAQFSWDFGDGHGSNGLHAEHHYDQPGTYTVCLIADWLNCIDTACTVITVGATDPCTGLQAGFTWYTTPNGTLFSNGTTGTGFQTTFSWTFGDGSSSNDAQPFHTYAADGVYEACLQVISIFELPGGSLITCVDDTCMTVVIGEPSPCDSLNAGFIASGGLGGVNFANAVIDLSWTYQWYFGDGTEGYGPNPYHTFPGAGTYQVCLVVSTWAPQTQDSCFANHCEMVVITGGNPCDNLNAGFQVTTDGPVATFHSSNSTAQHYEWHFGDGTSGYGPMPVHTYAEPGTYTACLLVWAWNPQTQDTCYADHCETVVILPTGLTEVDAANDGISTWPQPFSQELSIGGSSLNGSYRITLLDMAGRIADDRQLTIKGATQIDYRSIPPGQYILRLQGDASVRVMRVLKY